MENNNNNAFLHFREFSKLFLKGPDSNYWVGPTVCLGFYTLSQNIGQFNILGSMSHLVCIATTQVCLRQHESSHSRQTYKMNERGSVSIKLYLQKLTTGPWDIQNEWVWQCFNKTLFTKTYNWPSSHSSPSPGLNDYLYLLNFFSACCLLGSFHNKNYVCSLKVMFAHKNTEWRKSLGLWSQTGIGSRTAVWLRPSDLPSQGISFVPCKMEMMTVPTP